MNPTEDEFPERERQLLMKTLELSVRLERLQTRVEELEAYEESATVRLGSFASLPPYYMTLEDAVNLLDRAGYVVVDKVERLPITSGALSLLMRHLEFATNQMANELAGV